MGGEGRLSHASRRSGLRCIRGKRRVRLAGGAGGRVPQGDLEALAVEEERCLGVDAVGHGVLLLCGGGECRLHRRQHRLRGPIRCVRDAGVSRWEPMGRAAPGGCGSRTHPDIGAAARAANVGGMGDLKVAIADDSALMREGVARVLGDAGFEVVGAGRERRRADGRDHVAPDPTSWSSTSGCRPPTPTRACARAAHPPGASRASA